LRHLNPAWNFAAGSALRLAGKTQTALVVIKRQRIDFVFWLFGHGWEYTHVKHSAQGFTAEFNVRARGAIDLGTTHARKLEFQKTSVFPNRVWEQERPKNLALKGTSSHSLTFLPAFNIFRTEKNDNKF
jgi:hypothetical protein